MTYKVISPIGSLLKFFIQMCIMDLNTDADALPAIAKFKRNKSIGAAIKHCVYASVSKLDTLLLKF